ncbi:MAG: lysine-sensitive aspartokinase 3 [Bryobacterales bacterium]|nr:lysine-sensitive aspartokinase 3 [Bryobacterales bacterium]
MIVMKFGGSSVESRVAIDRVATIVAARAGRHPIVVVSAMGKTTNRLLALADHAVRGDRDRALTALKELEQFTIEEGGAVGGAVPALFQELAELVKGLAVLGELTPRSIDAISAFGERISSLIVAEAFRRNGLDAVHADSREYIVTDERHTQAAPLYPETYDRLKTKLAPIASRQIVVMGGFIGSTRAGVTTTLGRGGSDFSASIIGAGVDAEEIQIWTDVDGMLTCDPRILPVGHRVRVISFSEAAELAYFGAKVLHPSTVLPAIDKNIPVLILNSRRPEVEGTRIVSQAVPAKNVFKSIACKLNITLVHIKSTRMLMAHGYLRRIFEVFDRYQTSVDLLATSEISVSLTVDTTQYIDKIIQDLSEYAEVTVEEGSAIICLVGENIGMTPGIAGRVFASIKDVNVRMISQGASNLNLSFVVDGGDLRKAVAALHDEFFSDPDAQVFERKPAA